MNSMKSKKDLAPENGPHRSEGVHYVAGEEQKITPGRMKRLGKSRNDFQLWMCLVVKVKSDVIKNGIAWEPGMLGP